MKQQTFQWVFLALMLWGQGAPAAFADQNTPWTVKQITPNPVHWASAQISNQYVVWTAAIAPAVNSPTHIFLYNIKSGTIKDIGACSFSGPISADDIGTTIPNNPSISGNNLLYWGGDNLLLYDIAKNRTTAIGQPVDKKSLESFDINGQNIVWIDAMTFHVTWRDATSGKTLQIAHDNNIKKQPFAESNKIVWLEQSTASHRSNIVIYDTNKGTTGTIDLGTDTNDIIRGISGEYLTILKHERPPGQNAPYFRDLRSPQNLVRVSPAEATIVSGGSTDGQSIVWAGQLGTKYRQIFRYDIKSRKNIQLTHADFNQFYSPIISAGLISWNSNPTPDVGVLNLFDGQTTTVLKPASDGYYGQVLCMDQGSVVFRGGTAGKPTEALLYIAHQ